MFNSCYCLPQTTLNNVEVSIEYTQTLKKSLTDECSTLVSQNAGVSKDKLDMCLSELTTHTHKFKDVLEVSELA